MNGRGMVDQLFQGNTHGTHQITMRSSDYIKENNQANTDNSDFYYINNEFYDTVKTFTIYKHNVHLFLEYGEQKVKEKHFKHNIYYPN